MLKPTNVLIVILLALLSTYHASAQNEINSPYSGFGIGLLNNTSNGTMAAMGGVSYAMQNPYYINYRNPASYVAFDSLSFIADASFSLANSTLKTNTLNQKGSFARFNYLTIGLPVTKHWRTSAGIIPYSDIGYKIKDESGEISYSYDGEGGLMQLYWGNAFKICKGLSIGLNASYIWGSMNSIRYVVYDKENFFNNRIAQNINVDGITLSVGLQYFLKIKEHHTLGFGVVYENSPYIWARENTLVQNYTGEYISSNSYDTVQYIAGEKGRMILPQSIGGGITYNFKNKIIVGADLTWQNWSNYKLMERSDSLRDCLNVSAGLQYTPDPTSTKYFKKVNFRLGGKYSSGYFSFYDTPIREYGFTLGLGFPIKTFTSQSTINIMVEYGRMGTTSHNLILQDYFKFSLSFILQEKWYQRVRLE